MTTDVLIGQAYFLRFDPSLWEAARPYAPLGALYAAAWARSGGYRVAFFDAMLAQSVEEWTAALERHQPSVAVIYEDSFNYLSKMCLTRMRDAALEMIAAACQRGVAVIVAGSDATDHPAIYLQQGATAVIAGEGDVTLVHLLDALRRGDPDLSKVDGIVFSEDGRLVRTQPRAIMRDLDAAPRPAWDLVDVERYRSIWQRRHGFFSMNISTTRGCPYHCNWCAKPIYGQRYTARSPEDVADEIAWLRTAYRPDHLWITDDIFGLKPGWVAAFARALAERNAATAFKCLMRADGVTADVVAALVAAGCRTVWIGAESGSQRVLDAMEKGTRVEQIERAAHLLHEAGIEVGFFLQFGYPGETLVEIEQTLAMVGRCRPDDIGLSVSYPLPGTFISRARPVAVGFETELGRFIGSGNDVSGHLFARVLPNAPSVRPRAVPGSRGWSTAGRLARAPGRATTGDLGAIASGVLQASVLPLLYRRVQRLARAHPSTTPAPHMIPLLSQQAASLPSEQGH